MLFVFLERKKKGQVVFMQVRIFCPYLKTDLNNALEGIDTMGSNPIMGPTVFSKPSTMGINETAAQVETLAMQNYVKKTFIGNRKFLSKTTDTSFLAEKNEHAQIYRFNNGLVIKEKYIPGKTSTLKDRLLYEVFPNKNNKKDFYIIFSDGNLRYDESVCDGKLGDHWFTQFKSQPTGPFEYKEIKFD